MTVKPYGYLPDYADVEYVDGKLRVARAALAASDTPQQQARWRGTVDLLLDQRSALVSLSPGEAS